MDFKKFQQWCENKGFIVKMPSGYSKLINLEVSSFESFKGIFNLCMLFFYEELYKQREEEKKEALKNFVEKYKDSPTILYPVDGDCSSPYVFHTNNDVNFVEKIKDAGVNKNKNIWNLEKYSDEDFEKLADYLLTPIPYEDGMVPMDKLLKYLDDKEKHENSESATSVDAESKDDSKSESKDFKFKHWFDRADYKYDSESSASSYDDAD